MFDSDYFPYAVTILIAIPFLVFAKQFVYGFLDLKKKELQLISGKSNNDIKLQAYERMTLFLERLKPSNLVMKFDKNLAVHEFLFLVEKSINEEFEYNASQQLYVSQTSWDNILTSKNNVIQLLHKTYENLSEDSKLEDFKTVFLMNYVNDEDYISESIDGLRNDVNKLI
ncbi:hypothetical protein SAMN05660477_01734 [Soonwooa buanensis]|uniref:Uncharacterized protein n=1 Tax=Soonwooa buanensis TaxID=619805 RepID=A0A1T5F2L3_9FLAO|nr:MULTISPECIES: hypothetical protein [Soonwooa]SKB90425.1 hypothetical protein SAMN05660477_01734 [Soonwooa buanensis]